MPSDHYPYHIIGKPYDIIIINGAGAFRPNRALNTLIDFSTRVGYHPNYNVIWDLRHTERIVMTKEQIQSHAWKVASIKNTHSIHRAIVCSRGCAICNLQAIMRNTSVDIRERTRFFLTLGHAFDWLGTLRSPDGRLAA